MGLQEGQYYEVSIDIHDSCASDRQVAVKYRVELCFSAEGPDDTVSAQRRSLSIVETY
jgi:hypothetical protein